MPGGIHPPHTQWLIWPAPNYIDPPAKPKYGLFFACLLGPVSAALTLARMWVRIRVQKSAGWDDWLMGVAWIPVIALTIIFPLVTEKYQFTRHSWGIEFFMFPIQRRFVLAIYALFAIASGLIRCFRWTLRITIAVIGIYTLIFVLVTIFACTPISAFWNQENFLLIASGTYKYKCLDEGAEIVANGVISTVQDFITATLPALLVLPLHLLSRQKLALYAVFAISYLAVGVGAMRTYASYHLFFETYDVTWAACDIWLWSLLELHIGCLSAEFYFIAVGEDIDLEEGALAV